MYGFYNENFKGPLLILFKDTRKIFCHHNQKPNINVEFNASPSTILLKTNNKYPKSEVMMEIIKE